MADETPQYDYSRSCDDGELVEFVGRVGRFDLWYDPGDEQLPWMLVWRDPDDANYPWRLWGAHAHSWLRADLTPTSDVHRHHIEDVHITPHEWCLIHQRAAEYTNQKEPNQ